MRLAPWMVALLLLTGCRGSRSRDPELIINNQQSLVMDLSVLTPALPPRRRRLPPIGGDYAPIAS